MASSNSVSSSSPPPLSAPVASNGHISVIVVVVFVSLGGLLLLACFASILCFLIRKKSKKRAEKSETVRFDEHYKMKEAIVDGPHGRHAVMLQVEDDVRMEDKFKNEATFRKDGLGEGNPNPVDPSSNSGIEKYYSPTGK